MDIYRCYCCKYINIEKDIKTCPLCGSKFRYLLLNSSPDEVSTNILEYMFSLNLKAKKSYALWDRKEVEEILDPYKFYIEKHYGKTGIWVNDRDGVFLNIYNKINGMSVYTNNFHLIDMEIHRTLMRLIFSGIKLKDLRLQGKMLVQITDDITSWTVNIIRKSVKLVLRDIKFLREHQKVKNIVIYDLWIDPKLLAYLELFYNQELLEEREFIRRQKMLLDLMDLYKDYSKWEEEFDELFRKCMEFIKHIEPSESIKNSRANRLKSVVTNIFMKFKVKVTQKPVQDANQIIL